MCTFRFLKYDAVLLFFLILLTARCRAQGNYWCSNKEVRNPGPLLPEFPSKFTTRMQVNYESHKYTSEILRVVDFNARKESVEIWAGKRHVRYISLGDDDQFLSIVYQDDGPSCTAMNLNRLNKLDVYNEKDAGPFRVLELIEEVILPKKDKFETTRQLTIRGMLANQWEICEYVEDLQTAVKVTLLFLDPSWTAAYNATVKSDRTKADIVRMKVEARGGKFKIDLLLTVDFYSYIPNSVKQEDFEVPEGIHCEDFRVGVTLPNVRNYFTYRSEILQKSTAVNPVVSHRAVYYDYKKKIARVDSDESEGKATVSAKSRTDIYDFEHGVRYAVNPDLNTCTWSKIEKTFDFLAESDSSSDMLVPAAFFGLSDVKISFTGQYETRGLNTNVYSGKTKVKNEPSVLLWYFTAASTKLIEGGNVKERVLVKLVSRPESGSESQRRTEINFYNFNNEEPASSTFDITSCYNETESKTYVLTFPGDTNQFLGEMQDILQTMVHIQLSDTAKINPKRISVQKIYFGEPYFYVQFKLLDPPPFQKNAVTDKTKAKSIEEAERAISEEVSNGKFSFNVRNSAGVTIVLRPEPDGFKEFKAEKKVESSDVYFNERSVVGLSIGMTVLGLLLGGVLVNMIIARKYGVSLFQKTLLGNGQNSFDNPLHESSI